MTDFICPEFSELDQELKDDFYGSTQEAIELMDGCIDRLAVESNAEDLNELFRSMHSVKGNCNMVFIAPVVEALHELEEIVTDIRDNRYAYHPSYGEFCQAVIHETDEVLRDLMNTDCASQTLLDQLEKLISTVHQTQDDEQRLHIVQCATNAIMKGHFSLQQSLDKYQQQLEQEQNLTEPSQEGDSADEIPSSIDFFRQLAEGAHEIDPWRVIRLERTISLCNDLNKIFGSPVDTEQLLAAVYVHEFTMNMIPREILEKADKLDEKETRVVRKHVDMGAGLLRQVPGFVEASEIIKCHHEQINGEGYPAGKEGDSRSFGAVILAMAETFISITSDRPDRPYKKTLLTAVREINNAKGTQFSAEHVEGFNELIKKSYIAQARW